MPNRLTPVYSKNYYKEKNYALRNERFSTAIRAPLNCWVRNHMFKKRDWKTWLKNVIKKRDIFTWISWISRGVRAWKRAWKRARTPFLATFPPLDLPSCPPKPSIDRLQSLPFVPQGSFWANRLRFASHLSKLRLINIDYLKYYLIN